MTTTKSARLHFDPQGVRELEFEYESSNDLAYLYVGESVAGYNDEFEDNWMLRISDDGDVVRGIESTAFLRSLDRLPVIATAMRPAIEEIESALGRSLDFGDCQLMATPKEFPALFRAFAFVVGYALGRIEEMERHSVA